jgi:hypothetical protein
MMGSLTTSGHIIVGQVKMLYVRRDRYRGKEREREKEKGVREIEHDKSGKNVCSLSSCLRFFVLVLVTK